MCDSYIGLDQYQLIDLASVNDFYSKTGKASRVKGLEHFTAFS